MFRKRKVDIINKKMPKKTVRRQRLLFVSHPYSAVKFVLSSDSYSDSHSTVEG